MFNLSETYLADNVTVWSGVDYFCGYPSYEVFVINTTDDSIIIDSSTNTSSRNFTYLVDKESKPPVSTTMLVLNSTDNTDYKSSYLLEV